MRALVDLLFPATCAGCGSLGASVCSACLQPLQMPALLRMPTPAPHGMPPAFSVSAYDGKVRSLLLAFKERDAVGARVPLGTALAVAVAAAADLTARIALVPVPSTRPAVRRRGFDPALSLAQTAARLLRRAGADVVVIAALRHARSVADSAGLSAAQRLSNLEGALVLRRRCPSSAGGRTVVVVDDVVTTGATITEATRALRGADIRPVAAATVAATSRRAELAQPGLPKVHLGDYGAW